MKWERKKEEWELQHVEISEVSMRLMNMHEVRQPYMVQLVSADSRLIQ